ncbi:DoxX family protein [Pseudomonas savastanoi]|uniref:DoxX family protein n=1 Tax=Pseudomonas savastanoi TaxID=29438 RepID=UPI001F2BD0BA|nr:DoxX family protein [Pseudomonas savastanoi]
MNTMIKSVLNTRAGYGLTLLRVIVGIAFIAHGSQKLFGAFGGYGLEGTAQYMESLGLTPGYLMALMSGSAEFFGGLGLLLGLLARPAAVVVILLLLVAIFTVHIHNGFFMADSVEKVGISGWKKATLAFVSEPGHHVAWLSSSALTVAAWLIG